MTDDSTLGRPASEDRPHEWYDDEFCPGGGAFVGLESPKATCPKCGESIDVNEAGYLFKHRPHIPKSDL